MWPPTNPLAPSSATFTGVTVTHGFWICFCCRVPECGAVVEGFSCHHPDLHLQPRGLFLRETLAALQSMVTVPPRLLRSKSSSLTTIRPTTTRQKIVSESVTVRAAFPLV